MAMNTYEIEHLAKIRKGLAECMVLLKSDGTFPLDGPCEIAAYGRGVRHTIKGGTGSGEVNSRFCLTVEGGLTEAGFTITTRKWLEAYSRILDEAGEAFIKSLRKKAKKEHSNLIAVSMGAVMPEPEYDLPLNGSGDTAIYVVSRISGEGNDRTLADGDYCLTKSEIRDILACRDKYKKFMLIINAGGPVDLTPVMDVENILVMSQLGVEMGAALADVLLGNENPSGKLATTWASAEGLPPYEFACKSDTHYEEGVYVGYRYYDSFDKPVLFPFGYGKSYTTFSVGNGSAVRRKDVITVSCDVTNTGARAGKEVVQVYVSAPQGKLDKPYQSLVGFAKTSCLEAGESELVVVDFKLADMASYDEVSAAYILEPGDYIVRVGTSSRDTRPAAIIRISETITVKQLKNALGSCGFTDAKPEAIVDRDDKPNFAYLPIIAVTPDMVDTEVVAYGKAWKRRPGFASLSDEELAYLSIGAFDPKGGIQSIIGGAASHVAGAAGESTSTQTHHGFPAMVMADGPAGLRLSRQYFVDDKGAKRSLGISMPETMFNLLPKVLRTALKLTEKKPKKGQEIKEQYTTAIPIGTALAQSFNVELAETCGDVVGTEMEIFGVHLWLAPALNIHRSVLCGRNFEYFSEDPLVSGKMAASLTRGVQKHKGCGTTIKHFCANNQETNRYYNNSLVSERAMREIYLKGFEICVRESQPAAVMTSYNLLNGIHTSERRDLTEDILRGEFGFEGIVMTDWVVGDSIMGKAGKYASPEAWKVAAAGSELFMPGGKKDYMSVLKALKDGRLSREQAEINATRLYETARRLVK